METVDIDGLIGRARELAALAKRATPGPWEVFGADAFPRMGASQFIAKTWNYRILRLYQVDSDDRANARLIAAAPEMAEHLGKLADVLEEWVTVRECPECGNINEKDQCRKCTDCDLGAYPCCGSECQKCGGWLCPDCQETHECRK